jgi:hypothetical protein
VCGDGPALSVREIRGDDGMSEIDRIPSEFLSAYRWRHVLAWPIYAAILFILAGAIFHNFWLFAGFFLGFPSAYALNLKCYKCSWPVIRQYGRDPKSQDWMFGPLVKPLRFPKRCTKCGARFANPRPDEVQ